MVCFSRRAAGIRHLISGRSCTVWAIAAVLAFSAFPAAGAERVMLKIGVDLQRVVEVVVARPLEPGLDRRAFAAVLRPKHHRATASAGELLDHLTSRSGTTIVYDLSLIHI